MESFTITIRSKVGAHWPIVVELSGAKTPLVIRREGVLELDLEALWTQVTPRDYGTMLDQALFRFPGHRNSTAPIHPASHQHRKPF